jgi:lipopolysaccharide transport system permease protein
MDINSAIKTVRYRLTRSNQIELIWHLVKREFNIQYKRSILGVLWSLLLPLGQLLVLVLVFQKILPLNIDSYPVFLFSALLPWTWFSNCLSTSGDLFLKNRDLLKKPNFEPSTLVIVNTLSNLLLFLISLPLLFILMFLYEKPFTLALLILPLLIIIQGILMSGLGLIIATLNTFYSDVQQIVGVALLMLFFLTPVFYGYHDIGKNYRFLYSLNPMATLIQNYRLILYSGVAPTLVSMSFAFVSSIIAGVLGYVVYSRQANNLIDII